MTKTKKSQYIKSALLVLSTLLVPVQFFSLVFNFLSFPYVSFVVPYLLWRIWFNRDEYRASKVSYLWKIPSILVIVVGMLVTEFLLFYIYISIMSSAVPFSAVMVIFDVMLLVFRCLTYAVMIFIWRPNILKTGKKWACLGVILYCVTIISFLGSTIPAL